MNSSGYFSKLTLYSTDSLKKKMPFRSEHNTVKHPTGIPLTLSNIPKVEAAWGYGGDWLAQLPVPCWSTVGARHGQIARAARRGGSTELVGTDHSSATTFI